MILSSYLKDKSCGGLFPSPPQYCSTMKGDCIISLFLYGHNRRPPGFTNIGSSIILPMVGRQKKASGPAV